MLLPVDQIMDLVEIERTAEELECSLDLLAGFLL
jgi:hypothetical protein